MTVFLFSPTKKKIIIFDGFFFLPKTKNWNIGLRIGREETVCGKREKKKHTPLASPPFSDVES